LNTQTLFQKISQKMRTDFEVTAQVVHSGSKGTARENILRNFLAEGRLPTKYAIGSGEVVGRTNDTSKQCDLVVYDRLNGVTLLYDESTQVYPIDCVYGIIEVKSTLSKSELIDALEKIKTLKTMAPEGFGLRIIGNDLVQCRARPFGVIFAYGLADNSLDSLLGNLQEWERETDHSLWPNYICVLETGVIFHRGRPFEVCIDSTQIAADARPFAVAHNADSLFQFYCALHDLCANMVLAPLELRHYFKPSIRIGKYIVGGITGVMMNKEDVSPRQLRFTEAVIDRIVAWCSAKGPMRFGELLDKQFGPMRVGEHYSPAALNELVYLYNPDNLPGLHEIGPELFARTEKGATFARPCLTNALNLDIDNRRYIVTMDSFQATDFDVNGAS
jgi:hypothetical protein